MKILKPLSYISFLFVLSITACSKHTAQAIESNGLTGTWQWVRSDGGFGYHIHDTPASTGKSIELRFSGTDHYAFYTNGTLTSEGTYTLEKKQCIHDKTEKPFINFSAATDRDMMIEKNDNGSLELSDEAYDGIGSMYKRISSTGK